MQTIEKEVETQRTDTMVKSHASSLSEQQHDLEHQVLRAIVEGEGFVLAPETQGNITKLREVNKRIDAGKGKLGADPVLITFATVVITTAVAALVRWFEYLIAPPVGSVAIYNPGPPIRVWTYDEGDFARWVAYKEYFIDSNTVVPLTARGNNAIQIVVIGKPQVHTCAKGQAYAFNGSVMEPRS